MLEGAVLRQIEAKAQGQPYVFQHDLASAHTATATKGRRLKAEGVTVLPWMPAGADLNPLDVFVNNFPKTALKGKNVCALPLLEKEAAKAIAALREDKVWIGQVSKARLSFSKRVKRAAANR